MKVYSLYYKDTFVAAFSNREEAVSYGKIHYKNDPWDCNILEEYLSKSPLLYSAPYTPPNTIPPNITKLFSNIVCNRRLANE